MSEPQPCAESGRLPGEQDHALQRADGIVLRGYQRPGAGAGCGVFIHGLRSHCDGEKARALSRMAGYRGYPWLRFDQYGCGRSDGDFRRFTVSGAVADTGRLLTAAGHDRFILVGSSLGALIAVRLASAAPAHIAGLVLLAPALRFTDRFIHAWLGRQELETWRQRGYRWFPDLYDGPVYRLDYAFCADALRHPRPPQRLDCPVRVIHGSRDELLPPADSEKWLTELDCPSADLEIIDGGDHRLSRWSDVIVRGTEKLWNETF